VVTYGLSILLILGMECNYNMLCSVLFVCVLSWLGDAYHKVCLLCWIVECGVSKVTNRKFAFSYVTYHSPFIILHGS
jgi:hypothetical protein